MADTVDGILCGQFSKIEKSDKIFSNVKVRFDSNFDIKAMAEDIREPDTPYLVVFHTQGKKERHWHIVCVMKPRVKIEFYTENEPDKKRVKYIRRHLHDWPGKHTDKEMSEANHPISCPEELGDDGWFAYLLKPKEVKSNKNLIVETNLTLEQIEKYKAQSQEYHDAMKAEPLITVKKNIANAGETFYPYLVRIIEIHYKQLLLVGKAWGPGTTESLVAAIAKQYPEFICEIATSKARAYAPQPWSALR